MTLETRTLSRPVELRAQGDSGRTLVGYAVVFNSPAVIGADFREIIAPGAFAKSLKGDVRALRNHDRARVLGRTTSGTLRLREDDVGLAVEIDLPDTSDGRDIATLVERGDLDGMSFGFIAVNQTWDETGDVPTRTIHEAALLEVTVATFPAYDDTTIALRSLDEARKEKRGKNFSAAAARLRLKADLDLRQRARSKAG